MAVDFTAVTVAVIGTGGGAWALVQSRLQSRDSRRERQSPLARETQAITDERASHQAAYDRLTTENARLDRALEEAYRDVDALRTRLNEANDLFDHVRAENERLHHEVDGLSDAARTLTDKVAARDAQAAILEASLLHHEVDHRQTRDHDHDDGDGSV